MQLHMGYRGAIFLEYRASSCTGVPVLNRLLGACFSWEYFQVTVKMHFWKDGKSLGDRQALFASPALTLLAAQRKLQS